MQEKQQHGPGVRAGVCGAGTEGASGAGGFQSSTRLQNTHEHRLLQPASAPRCALGPVGPPQTRCWWAMPQHHRDAQQAPGPYSAATVLPPPFCLSLLPSPPAPQRLFMQSTPCSCPQAASHPRTPHQTHSSSIPMAPQGAPSRHGAARSEGRRYRHPRPEWLLPLSPDKTLQQFFAKFGRPGGVFDYLI